MCGGLKAAPENADRGDRIPLLADLAVPVDDVLGRCELPDADRAPRMQLLGRVSDLRPHPELVAVDEPGRRVDVNDPESTASVNAAADRVARHDGLPLARSVPANVRDRLVHRVHDPPPC